MRRETKSLQTTGEGERSRLVTVSDAYDGVISLIQICIFR